MKILDLKCLLVLTGVLMLAACSSGSDKATKSSSSSVSSSSSSVSKPDENGYSISLSVAGLRQGQAFFITNGVESSGNDVYINQNGTFQIWQGYPSGTRLKLRITVPPSAQHCELAGTKGLLVRDIHVVVNCADMVERPVKLARRPLAVTYSELEIASNYATIEKGKVKESGNNLRIYDNSFVVTYVKDSDNKLHPLFVNHVHDLTAYLEKSLDERQNDPILVGPKATAQALVLLNPTIASAILERVGPLATAGQYTHVGAVIDAVWQKLDDSSDLNEVEEKLKQLTDQKIGLDQLDSDFNDALQKLLLAVAFTLVSDGDLALAGLPSTGYAQSGLAVEPSIDDETQDFSLNLTNFAGRYVAVSEQSAKLEDLHLEPFSSAELKLDRPLETNEALNVKFIGPGVLSGVIGQENQGPFVQATAQSILELQFLPALSFYLGLQAPQLFEVEECLSEAGLDQLQESFSSYLATLDLSESLEFDSVFNALYKKGQQELLLNFAQEESLLHEIFNCDKLGPTAFFDSHRQLAYANTKQILSLIERLYVPEEIRMDLSEFLSLTKLIFAINSAQSQVEWSYSINLAASASHPAQALVGQEVSFKGECFDPRVVGEAPSEAYIPCTMQWDFGDGTILEEREFTGGVSEAKHQFTSPGSYEVVLHAKTEDGGQVSSRNLIQVLSAEAQFSLEQANCSQDLQCLEISNGATLDLGQVKIGETAFYNFVIRNVGTDNLSLDDISNAMPLVISASPNSAQISPGASRSGQISFSPQSAQEYVVKLTFVNNDVDEADQLFSVYVKGAGVGDGKVEPTNGSWKVVGPGIDRQGSIESVVASRAGTVGLGAVRMFDKSNGSGYPQVAFSNLNLPSSIAVGQTVELPLDDVVLDGSIYLCRGFVALSVSTEDFYCTASPLGDGSTTTENVSGVLRITGQANNKWLLKYNFEAAKTSFSSCDSPDDISKCDRVSVSGQVEVSPIR